MMQRYCFVTDLNCTFLLNCSRTCRQCPYYQSHLVADGGYFEKKANYKKILKGDKVSSCSHC